MTDDTLRMYAVVRKDLNMTPGKMAAQTGHAFSELTRRASIAFDDEDAHHAWRWLAWKQRHGIKIVMSAKNEGAIRKIFDFAHAAGLFTAWIVDKGLYGVPDELKDQDTPTVVGIGPATRAEVKDILRRARLVE